MQTNLLILQIRSHALVSQAQHICVTQNYNDDLADQERCHQLGPYLLNAEVAKRSLSARSSQVTAGFSAPSSPT
uniref:Uncharacterized protein n=1 Tax=Rhizophora mucronata TaxID=61149 RepID=A0A2P2L2Q5_RHIMU